VQIVDDDENGFSPGSMDIEIGQSITFVNLDDDDHTATSVSWDTGTIEPGGSVTLTFDEAGSFPFACQIHPEMTGTITVGDQAQASPQASPEASPASSTPIAGGGAANVAIQDFAFEPQTVEITAGTTVTWTNDDQAPHTATGLDGAFDTGTIEPGQSATHTFDTAGSFDYQCAFHPDMTGTVIVT
jgi:plastocyanin